MKGGEQIEPAAAATVTWGGAAAPVAGSVPPATVASVKPIMAVVGPSDAGPGERDEMLRRAGALLLQAGAEDVHRIDVPGRGAAEEGDGTMRGDVEGIIPALQSGSLFGGVNGVLVVDAQQLQAAEAGIVADLLESVDGSSVVVCLVSVGRLPAVLAKAVRSLGETTTVKKMREREAGDWLGREARERRIVLDPGAAQALLQRFGTDTAALGGALDQMETVEGPVTAAMVSERFRNRPDEPMWHYSDAVAAGDVGGSLRRLADFLTHGHPLQLLAFVQGDLKRRSLAAAAPTIDMFAEWVGASPEHYPVKKAWAARDRATTDQLRRALGAIAKADLHLKTMPEPTHRVMMERLTVTLARSLGGTR